MLTTPITLQGINPTTNPQLFPSKASKSKPTMMRYRKSVQTLITDNIWITKICLACDTHHRLIDFVVLEITFCGQQDLSSCFNLHKSKLFHVDIEHSISQSKRFWHYVSAVSFFRKYISCIWGCILASQKWKFIDSKSFKVNSDLPLRSMKLIEVKC